MIRKSYQDIYGGAMKPLVDLRGGLLQISSREQAASGHRDLPSIRLSDGTLRFICRMLVLLDPKPPPLICLDEPELGLHPDAIGTLANMIRNAAERTQLVIATHSTLLLDHFNEDTDVVFAFDRRFGSTRVTRIDPAKLEGEERLSERWMRGALGGVRW
jgi:predicted ATPase